VRILISSIVDPLGTAHNRLHEFIGYLSRRHEVTVVSIRDVWREQQVDLRLYRSGTEKWLRNVRIEYISHLPVIPVVQEILSTVLLGRLLRNLPEFDVHFSYNSMISGFCLASLLRRRGVRTVYDLADDLPAMIESSPQIPYFLRNAAGRLGRWVLDRNICSAEAVTLTTKSIAVDTSAAKKLFIVPNGVDVKKFHRREVAGLRKKLRLDGFFVLGYVGVLREWVDLSPAMGALRRLRDEGCPVKMLIAGEEWGIHETRFLAGEYTIADNVVFLGTVPYREVPKYISCMDAGMIPFRENAVASGAFPLKLLEYLACEVPVISTRLQGVEGVAGNLVWYASTEEQWYAAIKAILRRPTLAKAMAAKGRRLVERKFSWQRISEQIDTILRSAAVVP
jgi:glycosyltransferase involved in cell wall biosynthesis